MARNRLAGTKRGKSRTARFYQSNKASRKRKQSYDAKYNKNEQPVQQTANRKNEQRNRAALQRVNRRKGTHGNLDNKDEAHVSKSKTQQQSASKNRGDKRTKRIFRNK